MSLRSYQAECVDGVKRALKVHRRVLLQSPTGSGKTMQAAHMIRGCVNNGWRVMFLCHRDELVQQTSKTLLRMGIDHGFVAAGYPKDMRHNVLVCMVGTVGRRLEQLPEPNIIFTDECVSGDTLVETDVGLIRIDQVPPLGATKVKSSKDGRVVWRSITAWRNSGTKSVLSLNFSGGYHVRGTPNHPILTTEGWKPIGEITIGDHVLCSPLPSADVSSEHFSATDQLDCQIHAQSRHASHGLTPPSSLNGWLTRPGDSNVWARKCGSPLIRDGAKNQRAGARRASMPFSTSLHLCDQMEARSASHSNGLTESPSKASRGGLATTEVMPDALDMRTSIPRDSGAKKTNSCATGSRQDTGQQACTPMGRGTSFSPSEPTPPNECLRTYDRTSPPSCDTKWERVVSISYSDPEPVYDISVGETECFFGNGVLVHNCHHAVAGTWKAIIERFPNALIVGLSATPERLDGRGLDDIFGALVPGPAVRWLMDEGYLADYRAWSHAPPDLSSIKRRGADFDPAALATKMTDAHLVGDAVDHYLRICPGERAVSFCVNVEHANAVRDAFLAAGVTSASLFGESPKEERRRVLAAFRAGEVQVLTSVDLFGEGFDLPEVAVAILQRPTESLGLYLQQVGRVLRPVYAEGYPLETQEQRLAAIAAGPKPHAYILDHAGNLARHGLPDDEREWKLEGRKKGSAKSSGPGAKVCGYCFGSNPQGTKICRYCNKVFILTPREIEQIDGELKEIDREIARSATAAQPAKQAKSYDEIVTIFIARGNGDPAAAAENVWRSMGNSITDGEYLAACRRVETERGYKKGWAFFRARMRTTRNMGRKKAAVA
jgi:DNA repair protein RadD